VCCISQLLDVRFLHNAAVYCKQTGHGCFKYMWLCCCMITFVLLKFTHVILLLWKLNQTQPTKIYLDVSVSIRGLRQKKIELILPVLATVVMWCGKKSVVRVAQCVAALIPVHRTLSLFSNMHHPFDPSFTSVRLPIQEPEEELVPFSSDEGLW